jgi:hypothetical protein
MVRVTERLKRLEGWSCDIDKGSFNNACWRSAGVHPEAQGLGRQTEIGKPEQSVGLGIRVQASQLYASWCKEAPKFGPQSVRSEGLV